MLLDGYESRAAAAYEIFEIPGLANMAKELDSVYGFDSTADWGAQDVSVEIDDAQISQNLACGGQSFTATTRVLLANGKTRPIASLKPGDKVLATNMLSNAAYNARIGLGIGSGRNVAAAQVAGLDEPVIGISRGSGYHAENDILNHSKRKGSIQARLPPFTANGNRVLYVSRCLMKSYHPELRLHGQSHGALILQ
jgi:hypothetical protein